MADLNDSHRVGDTLTALLGYCELLLEDAYGPMTARQKRVLCDVLEAAKELQQDVLGEPRYVPE